VVSDTDYSVVRKVQAELDSDVWPTVGSCRSREQIVHKRCFGLLSLRLVPSKMGSGFGVSTFEFTYETCGSALTWKDATFDRL